MKLGNRELRIVGGTLRGRRWRFPETEGLRPTPDRVRETLFNWLAPHIAGARVLDLFAGSGALGFEAVSRGAAGAVLVERDRAAAALLRETADRFGLAQVRVEGGDALGFLRGQPAAAFDVIFLDPPFAAGLLAPALQAIAAGKVLADGGWCYVELAADQPLPPLPAGWRMHREGRAGEVGYHLLHAETSPLPRNI